MLNKYKSFQLMALGSLSLILETSTTHAQTATQLQCRTTCGANSSNPGYDSCKKRLACPEHPAVEQNSCKQKCNIENPNPSYFECVSRCGIPIPDQIKNPYKYKH